MTLMMVTEHQHTTPSTNITACVFVHQRFITWNPQQSRSPSRPTRRPSAPSAASLGSSSAGGPAGSPAGDPEGNPVAGTSPAAAAGWGSPWSAAEAPAGAAMSASTGANVFHHTRHSSTARDEELVEAWGKPYNRQSRANGHGSQLWSPGVAAAFVTLLCFLV